MKLELSPEAPYAPVVEVSRSSVPRDRLLQDVYRAIAWFVQRRFTVRASSAANVRGEVT